MLFYDGLRAIGFLRLFLVTSVVFMSLAAGASLRFVSAQDPDLEDALTVEAPIIGSAGLTSATTARNLTGRVYVWDQGRLRPAAQVRVSTGSALVRTDSSGRFEFTPDQRTGTLAFVQPGYDIVHRPVYYDQSTVILRNLVVRGIHIPFSEVNKQAVQDFVHRLVDADLINAVVIDIKSESGAVFEFAATDTVRQIGAWVNSDNLEAFLESLKNKGVYRIGRIVTFFDNWYSSWYPQNALHNLQGGPFTDGMGSRWSSAYSAEARRYNIDIGVAAAGYVEEIQYDYVRLPYESNLLERGQYTETERVAAINAFAREADAALHLAGLALSFDTFGVVSTAGNDQGIGQSVEGVAPYLDYVSPMVYPSGWAPGSFGYEYPPEHPGPVVQLNVQATVDRIAEDHSALVRPWLQDFHDYQARGLFYGSDYVSAQIEATAAAGGIGFMLWDPSLQFEQQALEEALSLTWPPY